MFSQAENDPRYSFILIESLREILLKIVMKVQYTYHSGKHYINKYFRFSLQ